jgi:DNA-binding transcriptional regulator LsrR (DeoR family)
MAACVKYDARQHRTMLDAFWTVRAPCGDDLSILSAEFGLIDAAQPVPDYDRKMDAARARTLATDAAQQAAMARAIDGHDTVAVYGGKTYRDMVRATLAAIGADVEVIDVVGANRGNGDHYSALVAILEDEDGIELWAA